MFEDEATTNKITERLMTLSQRRRRKRLRYSLLTLMLVMTLAPIGIWLLYEFGPDPCRDMVASVREVTNLRENKEDPLAIVVLPPAVLGSLVFGVVAFLVTRSLDSRRAGYLGFTLVTCALCVTVLGACLMAAESYGLCKCSAFGPGDFFVLIGVPLGLFVAAGGFLGWRLAELQ
jgi:hypothetical protein